MGYRLSWEGCNPTMTFFGHVTYQEILRCYNKILGHHCFDRIQYLITDYSDVQSVEVSEDNLFDIGTLVYSSTRWNNHIRNAQVARLEEAARLIRRFMKRMEKSGWTCRYFADRDEAKKWCQGA